MIIESEESSVDGVLYMQGLSGQRRLIRAAKIWALLWVLMVMSLPLMIIHFILVPGFLIAGPVVAMRRYRVMELPHHGEGHCPCCKQEVSLTADDCNRLPLRMPCPACKASLLFWEKSG
jgi:hypothetical protein